MNNLDFRKFLTGYGISYKEYEGMSNDQKQELIDNFNKEEKERINKEKSDNLQSVGKGLQGLGCLIILIPTLIVFLYFVFSMIF